MIKYERQDQYIMTFDRSQGVIIIDVNCQGIMELNEHQITFKLMFPKTYEDYTKLIIDRDFMPGDVFWFKEDGYDIALIATRDHVVGSEKDVDSDIKTYTEMAIETLAKTTEIPTMLCPLINKGMFHKHFTSAVHKFGKQLDWYVYTRT
jgi:hypothetical protein